MARKFVRSAYRASLALESTRSSLNAESRVFEPQFTLVSSASGKIRDNLYRDMLRASAAQTTVDSSTVTMGEIIEQDAGDPQATAEAVRTAIRRDLDDANGFIG